MKVVDVEMLVTNLICDVGWQLVCSTSTCAPGAAQIHICVNTQQIHSCNFMVQRAAFCNHLRTSACHPYHSMYM